MNRHPFDLLMELSTAHIRLDCAALHLARDFYPGVNATVYLRQLDELAGQVAALRPGLSAPLRYEAMRRVLVDDFGLTGDEDDYYDPQNCFIHRALDRRIGLPITLSAIWIEVARRLKWPVSGVGLPGHFLVRFDDPERYILVDPFGSGRTLTIQQCRELLEFRTDGSVPFSQSFLAPVDTRTILIRMLNNLRSVYLANNDLAALHLVLRRLAAVEPDNGQHLQDIAAVCCRLGDVRGAYAHLTLYLERAPQASDSALVRSSLKRLHAAMLALN